MENLEHWVLHSSQGTKHLKGVKNQFGGKSCPTYFRWG